MSYKNKIEVDLFVATLLLFSFLAVLGFFLIFAKGEGGFDQNKILFFVADHIAYLFPMALLGKSSFTLLILLAILNILLYSTMAVTIFTNKLKCSRRYKPFDLIHFIAYAIPAIFVITFVTAQLRN